jgi:hypothetical protein
MIDSPQREDDLFPYYTNYLVLFCPLGRRIDWRLFLHDDLPNLARFAITLHHLGIVIYIYLPYFKRLPFLHCPESIDLAFRP